MGDRNYEGELVTPVTWNLEEASCRWTTCNETETTLTSYFINLSLSFLSSTEMLWSRYQLLLIRSVPWKLHLVLGTIVALIGVLGTVANGIVLFIFAKFRKLRTPANIFVINLAISDLGQSLLHPLAAYSSFYGRWAFGKAACELYAMGVGFFGLNSIVTLTAVAAERCLVITYSKNLRWRITRTSATKICILIWLHCFALVLPPLFGWSAYVPEGLLTTCSWDYTTRTFSNRLYYVYLLLLGFVLPVIVIGGCYTTILMAVSNQGREIAQLAVPSQKTYFNRRRMRTDIRTAHVIVTIVILYLVTWTPYAVVSFIGQFGDQYTLTPFSTALPAFFAKGAVVYDPLVYVFSHPQFRLSLQQYLQSFTSSYPPTRPRQPGHAAQGQQLSDNGSTSPSSSSHLAASERRTRKQPAWRRTPVKVRQLKQRSNRLPKSKSFHQSAVQIRNDRDACWASEPDLTKLKRNAKSFVENSNLLQ